MQHSITNTLGGATQPHLPPCPRRPSDVKHPASTLHNDRMASGRPGATRPEQSPCRSGLQTLHAPRYRYWATAIDIRLLATLGPLERKRIELSPCLPMPAIRSQPLFLVIRRGGTGLLNYIAHAINSLLGGVPDTPAADVGKDPGGEIVVNRPIVLAESTVHGVAATG
jgi:hypothetical protein